MTNHPSRVAQVLGPEPRKRQDAIALMPLAACLPVRLTTTYDAIIRRPLRPTPYALRPTPYALRPTPYALRPTPYALCPTPYALRPTPYALPT